jgi:hypothetical protein
MPLILAEECAKTLQIIQAISDRHTIGLLEASRTFGFARRLPLPTLNHGITHSLIAKITSGGTSRNVVRDSSYNTGVARPVRWRA